jgi:hypothetical protein
MRIAICLSGQPRGLPLTADFFLEGWINSNDDVHVFAHQWFDPVISNAHFETAQPHQYQQLGTYNASAPSILIDKLKPKKILFEKPHDFAHLSHLENLPTVVQTQIASNFYSVWAANELKKEYEKLHGKFDVVVKTRLDLRYFKPVVLSEIVKEDEIYDHIYVPEIVSHMRINDSYPKQSGGTYSSMTDQVLIGSSENIDKMCDIYPNFERIHNEIKPFQFGECFMGYQRSLHLLDLKMVDIDYKIHRG